MCQLAYLGGQGTAVVEQALPLKQVRNPEQRPRYIKRCTGGASDRSNHAKTHEKTAMSVKPPFTSFRRRGTGGFSDSQYESVAVSGTP